MGGAGRHQLALSTWPASPMIDHEGTLFLRPRSFRYIMTVAWDTFTWITPYLSLLAYYIN